MQINTQKHLYSLGKCKLNEILLYTNRIAKTETSKEKSGNTKCWQECKASESQMRNGTVTLENSLVVSYKVEHAFTYRTQHSHS